MIAVHIIKFVDCPYTRVLSVCLFCVNIFKRNRLQISQENNKNLWKLSPWNLIFLKFFQIYKHAATSDIVFLKSLYRAWKHFFNQSFLKFAHWSL